MNLKIGGQLFAGVEIPLLWGTRAILQDKTGRLTVINLGGAAAKPEIVGDIPAPGIEFLPTVDGFKVLSNDIELYAYNPTEKTLASINLNLPNCQVTPKETRVGGVTYSDNFFIGYVIGIAVTENGISMGGPIPPNLAKLII